MMALPMNVSFRHAFVNGRAVVRVLLLCLTLPSVISLSGCNGGGDEADATATATYTALVYMVGSDLESNGGAATTDLNEMIQGGSTSAVNVIVETGGASQWQNPQASNESVEKPHSNVVYQPPSAKWRAGGMT